MTSLTSSPPLARALAERNYDQLTPVQTAVLADAASGRDLLVSAQTGSGKTVAYGLAIAKNLLGDYAATNYHEFWAVAVEIFFESPGQFRHELPDLYEAMATVLNQDPLSFVSGNTTIIRRRPVVQKTTVRTALAAIL